jgi:hypothetical protein
MKREFRTRAITIASASVLAASVLTSLSLAMRTAQAQAVNPVPLPPALANHPYAATKTGAQIAAWGPGSNAPGNCTNPNTSEISTNSDGDAVLTTSGATGDCVDLESPRTYPTTDGYVYETYVDFSNWTQWDSFWMYGSNWPTDGEIDATEGGDGINAISYHYEGTDGEPAAMSSCNDTNGCDGSATPLTTEPNNPEISPGWHTIDISFGGCGTGCGAIDVWYDGILYGTVSGTNVLDGGSTDDPYWITYSTGSCDADGVDVCNADNGGQTGGTMTVAWLRIFT